MKQLKVPIQEKFSLVTSVAFTISQRCLHYKGNALSTRRRQFYFETLLFSTNAQEITNGWWKYNLRREKRGLIKITILTTCLFDVVLIFSYFCLVNQGDMYVRLRTLARTGNHEPKNCITLVQSIAPGGLYSVIKKTCPLPPGNDTWRSVFSL
jgi:hypothetical protein